MLSTQYFPSTGNWSFSKTLCEINNGQFDEIFSITDDNLSMHSICLLCRNINCPTRIHQRQCNYAYTSLFSNALHSSYLMWSYKYNSNFPLFEFAVNSWIDFFLSTNVTFLHHFKHCSSFVVVSAGEVREPSSISFP